MLRLWILLFVCAYASAEYITTYNCTDKVSHSKDVHLEVSHCRASHERCPLYQGKNHTVNFLFTPTQEFNDKMDFRVFGVFEKFNVPYKGKSDAYENATYVDDGTKLKDIRKFFPNRQIRHSSEFSVSATYPKIQLRVRFLIEKRRTKQIVLCREIPVEIMSPPEDLASSRK